jgi:hypothetical protein
VAAETKNTLPLWLTVAITVCVSLPFGIWLGAHNLPIWVSFIVWAEYFAMGATPAALKTIVPAFILGVVTAAIIMTAYMLLGKAMGSGSILNVGEWAVTMDNVALFITCFVGFCIFIYAMKYFPVTQAGTLPFFNGISMGLGVFFTGAFTKAVGADIDPNLLPAVAAVGAILAGLLGAFLGWFNVVILFPRPVSKAAATAPSAA